MPDEPDPETKTATCCLCERPVTDDALCHGCKSYVCEACDQNPDVMGHHDVAEHQAEPEPLTWGQRHDDD